MVLFMTAKVIRQIKGAAVDKFLNNPNIGLQEGMDLVGQHYRNAGQQGRKNPASPSGGRGERSQLQTFKTNLK